MSLCLISFSPFIILISNANNTYINIPHAGADSLLLCDTLNSKIKSVTVGRSSSKSASSTVSQFDKRYELGAEDLYNVGVLFHVEWCTRLTAVFFYCILS